MNDAMTRHLHETANAVLYRALDLPAGDRQQFIAQATAGDLELFENVRTMLSRIEQLDQFLEDPLELPAEPPPPPPPVTPGHGELIGDWRVEHELGRNGADLILLVRSTESGQHATMRLAQSVSRTGQTSARFERLRARLAALQHPAIPAPIDGGSTPDGRPYFVVGRGSGVPIDAYCAAHGLNLAQRARLFAQVCRAVHYMHQHLIVHRDLKPADMLFDAAGKLTLLDAGMIGEGWPLDPGYASPDQLAGLPLSAGSDIYSLGAVLYLLLSGRQAHGGGDAGGVIGTAARASVMPPSTAVRSAIQAGTALAEDAMLAPTEALADSLQQHVDGIVARAMAADPAERYASAHALAVDLEEAAARLETPAAVAPVVEALEEPSAEPESQLAAEPVLAAPAPRRSPVSAIALAVAMLAVGAAAGVFAAPWLQQSGWLNGVSSPALPAPVPAGKAALPKASADLAINAAPATARETLALAGARYQDALATARRTAGDLPGAAQAAAQAVSLAAMAPAAQRDQAGADAKLRLGAILAEQGSTAEGLAALRSALSLLEAHAVMDGDKTQAAPLAVADAHRAIAAVLSGSDDAAGAETELAAARAIYAARLQATPEDAALRAALIDTELARAAAQNTQKHGRDTVATLTGLRRLATSPDARIDLLEAYVQPRGTPAQAYSAGQAALGTLRAQPRDPLDATALSALARAAAMTGEIGVRARQDKAACGNFDEAARLYEELGARATAFDRAAVVRLDAYKKACS
jgi:hypothetical protein